MLIFQINKILLKPQHNVTRAGVTSAGVLRWLLAATHGMHDLYPIARCKGMRGIATARHDLLVDFHGDAPLAQGQGFYQLCRRVPMRDAAGLSIDDNFHAHSVWAQLAGVK